MLYERVAPAFQHLALERWQFMVAPNVHGNIGMLLYLQKKDDVYALDYGGGLTYGDLHKRQEREFSSYNFETADAALLSRHFNEWEKEGERLVGLGDPLPAYDCVVRTSHLFNTLDARGAISVSERTANILKVRDLACAVARAQRKRAR